MNPRLLAALLVAALVAPAMAQAQEPSATRPASDAAASGDMTAGEVRKVDKEAKKITLRHQEIKSLDMPPMTMVFQARDALMLDAVKAGDKVRFRAEKAGTGFVITAIELER